jgi:hypothetical protein
MTTAHRRPGGRVAAAAIGLAALTVTALTATTAAAAPSPSAAPESAQAALGKAVTGLQGQGYNVSGTSGSTASGGSGSVTATGSVDPSTKAAAVEFKGSEQGNAIDVAFTGIGDALYARLDLGSAQKAIGVDPNQWITIDQSKVNGSRGIPFDLTGQSDAFDIGGLLTSTNDVVYPDPADHTKISGTVDLAAAQGVSSPDPSDLGKAGTNASMTPFTATLDAQGRLTDLKINADGFDGNLTEEIAFTDFGHPDPVTAPANSVPAPDSAYAFFNS